VVFLLAAIESKHHSLIEEKIREQLTHQPNIQTRNRKPLEGNTRFGDNAWEIRFGQHNRFRGFYNFNLDDQTVLILAIGVKEKYKLYISGEEVKL
jgi:hypothetical protein